MDIQNIPWRIIDAKLSSLGPGHNQAWLARQLNVGTNVIANWRSRGGAPLSRASELARVLGCSTDELLKSSSMGRKDAGDRSANRKTDAEDSLVRVHRALSTAGQIELQRFADYLLSKEKGKA